MWQKGNKLNQACSFVLRTRKALRDYLLNLPTNSVLSLERLAVLHNLLRIDCPVHQIRQNGEQSSHWRLFKQNVYYFCRVSHTHRVSGHTFNSISNEFSPCIFSLFYFNFGSVTLDNSSLSHDSLLNDMYFGASTVINCNLCWQKYERVYRPTVCNVKLCSFDFKCQIIVTAATYCLANLPNRSLTEPFYIP